MLRKTVIPMPPAMNTNGPSLSSGSVNFPFGSSTSTSAPTGSSASVRLKAVSRNRVQRPSRPRSFGEVTTVMCRRSPFSSSWPMSGSVTKKYWPGSNSTSRPRRSKVTSSVPFATSRFSLIRARIWLHVDRRQEDEDDGRHREQPVQRHDRHREVLLGRRVRRRRRRSHRACLPALPPDGEHRPTEGSDRYQDRECDPGEGIAVVEHVDDPENEAACRQPEVSEDQPWPELPSGSLLAHAATANPDCQEHKSAARGDDPADERSPLHLSASFRSCSLAVGLAEIGTGSSKPAMLVFRESGSRRSCVTARFSS